MTFGTLSAMMAADAFAKRKNPRSQLFDVNRKKLSGVWDYLVENKDYPFYMAKEWLAKPGARSLRGVKRGEGKIVVLGGSKVAAYREKKGKLSVKSAVAPTWAASFGGTAWKRRGTVRATAHASKRQAKWPALRRRLSRTKRTPSDGPTQFARSKRAAFLRWSRPSFCRWSRRSAS
ncbi:MAG: hypothetical protein QOE70_522 [Chthoniobacter sp.]|nr:hypothetical protein [Chthoniobacter sp.]